MGPTLVDRHAMGPTLATGTPWARPWRQARHGPDPGAPPTSGYQDPTPLQAAITKNPPRAAIRNTPRHAAIRIDLELELRRIMRHVIPAVQAIMPRPI